MNSKAQWKDEVLNSLDGIQQAVPDEQLLAQIMARLPKNKLNTTISTWQLTWLAIAACVLVVLNIYVLGIYDTVSTENMAITDNIVLLNNYSLY